jgi:hypothetical protein
MDGPAEMVVAVLGQTAYPESDLLAELCDLIRRFVVVTDVQADTLALWVAHTHVFDVFETTPYLAITSPEKRSGKTRLLEVLELVVSKPLVTANISDAALFRVIEERSPTLLIDEVDALMRAREREELRGLLNAGYRKGAEVYRMGGGNNTTLQSFKVYAPKALAGIGDCLPDTIADRAISVRLTRRTRAERIERFRLRDVAPAALELRDALAAWIAPHESRLTDLRPELPSELDDRAQDVWEPLLAVADLAGGDWPVRARRAAVVLSTGDERVDESVTATLLRDVHGIFSSNGHTAYRTAELLERLHKIEESPWGEMPNGKPLSPHGLSRLLKPYRIRTMSVRDHGSDPVRGYKFEQFRQAFASLALQSVTSVTDFSQSQTVVTPVTLRNASDANPDDIDFGRAP